MTSHSKIPHSEQLLSALLFVIIHVIEDLHAMQFNNVKEVGDKEDGNIIKFHELALLRELLERYANIKKSCMEGECDVKH